MITSNRYDNIINPHRRLLPIAPFKLGDSKPSSTKTFRRDESTPLFESTPIFHSHNAIKGAAKIVPILANALSRSLSDFTTITTEELHSLHKSTSLQFDDSTAQQAAINHFKQFTRQHDLFVKDYNELVKLGSLHDLILKRQREYQKNKFNFARWKEVFSKDACLHGDVSRLHELATTGSTLGVPTDFIPLYYPPPMRGQYKYLGNTYTAHVQSLLQKGCIIVLPLKAIDELNLKINFTTSAWWAPKANKPEGRFCIDPTNAPNRYIGLNTPETLQTAIDKYVATNLPTLQSLITHQIIDVANKFKCPVSELTLYKSDIKSAFYSTIVNPSDVTLLSTRISETEFMLHISGSFGLNSQPVVFGLLGRNFNYKLQQVISGSTDIYIDDTCGSTRDDLVNHDIQQIINKQLPLSETIP